MAHNCNRSFFGIFGFIGMVLITKNSPKPEKFVYMCNDFMAHCVRLPFFMHFWPQSDNGSATIVAFETCNACIYGVYTYIFRLWIQMTWTRLIGGSGHLEFQNGGQLPVKRYFFISYDDDLNNVDLNTCLINQKMLLIVAILETKLDALKLYLNIILYSRWSFTYDSSCVLWDASCVHGCYSCLNGH